MKAFLGYMALLIVGVALDGYAMSKLWAWFVAPALGIRPIGVAVGAGIMCVGGLFRAIPEHKERTREEEIAHYIAALARPVIALLIGGVIHMLM